VEEEGFLEEVAVFERRGCAQDGWLGREIEDLEEEVGGGAGVGEEDV